jgi:DNA polymerase delta subunit 1
MFAKSVVETEFGAEVIYGDTDSIFVKFPTKDLAEAIALGKKAAERITSQCRKAHKIEYEKTFFPFILFCRKRYMGLKYEDDPTKCKRVGMGIALKRRDNAPIVKDIFGGALDILMEERSLKNAQNFVKDMLVQVMQNKMPLDKFVITKQLRDDYKNPGQIAHRVLADRMEERDAGNAPQVGDRLAYIYVAENAGRTKQGDRIEHIDYVKSKGLHPDTIFYVKNQIQNPVAQLFALGIEQLDGYVPKKYPTFPDLDEEEGTLAVLKLKEKELEKILFLGSNELSKIVIKQGSSMVRGPMDMFLKR